LPPRPCPSTCRPVQWPEHVGVRVADGGDHPRGHLVARHPQLGVHAGHHEVEPGQQGRLLVQRPVLEDVALDAGQQPERRASPACASAAKTSLSRATTSSCSRSRSGLRPLATGQPRRVVGEHQVLVAEAPGRPGHLLDRRAAVGPVGVGGQSPLSAARSAARPRSPGCRPRSAPGAGRPAPRRRATR
jgi:hypothetical protein